MNSELRVARALRIAARGGERQAAIGVGAERRVGERLADRMRGGDLVGEAASRRS